MGLKAPFFVTGLPRSGTAWIANLLSTGFTLCHHDLLGDVADMDQFSERVGERIGDSDSGLLAVYPEVHARFPAAHWVLVERPVEEAITSLRALHKRAKWKPVTPEHEGLMLAKLTEVETRMRANPKVLRIQYADVFREAGARALWGHCIDVMPFNVARFEMLRRLRVERIPETMNTNPQLRIT